jgi:hypothetical protein
LEQHQRFILHPTISSHYKGAAIKNTFNHKHKLLHFFSQHKYISLAGLNNTLAPHILENFWPDLGKSKMPAQRAGIRY